MASCCCRAAKPTGTPEISSRRDIMTARLSHGWYISIHWPCRSNRATKCSPSTRGYLVWGEIRLDSRSTAFRNATHRGLRIMPSGVLCRRKNSKASICFPRSRSIDGAGEIRNLFYRESSGRVTEFRPPHATGKREVDEMVAPAARWREDSPPHRAGHRRNPSRPDCFRAGKDKSDSRKCRRRTPRTSLQTPHCADLGVSEQSALANAASVIGRTGKGIAPARLHR